MWQFIVSGYIPGTDIQLSYDIIATFFIVSASTYLLVRFIRSERELRREVSRLIQSRSI